MQGGDLSKTRGAGLGYGLRVRGELRQLGLGRLTGWNLVHHRVQQKPAAEELEAVRHLLDETGQDGVVVTDRRVDRPRREGGRHQEGLGDSHQVHPAHCVRRRCREVTRDSGAALIERRQVDVRVQPGRAAAPLGQGAQGASQERGREEDRG